MSKLDSLSKYIPSNDIYNLLACSYHSNYPIMYTCKKQDCFDDTALCIRCVADNSCLPNNHYNHGLELLEDFFQRNSFVKNEDCNSDDVSGDVIVSGGNNNNTNDMKKKDFENKCLTKIQVELNEFTNGIKTIVKNMISMVSDQMEILTGEICQPIKIYETEIKAKRSLQKDALNDLFECKQNEEKHRYFKKLRELFHQELTEKCTSDLCNFEKSQYELNNLAKELNEFLVIKINIIKKKLSEKNLNNNFPPSVDDTMAIALNNGDNNNEFQREESGNNNSKKVIVQEHHDEDNASNKDKNTHNTNEENNAEKSMSKSNLLEAKLLNGKALLADEDISNPNLNIESTISKEGLNNYSYTNNEGETNTLAPPSQNEEQENILKKKIQSTISLKQVKKTKKKKNSDELQDNKPKTIKSNNIHMDVLIGGINDLQKDAYTEGQRKFQKVDVTSLESNIYCNNKNLRTNGNSVVYDKLLKWSFENKDKKNYRCICAIEITKKLNIVYLGADDAISLLVKDPTNPRNFLGRNQLTDKPIKDLRQIIKIQGLNGPQLVTLHANSLMAWRIDLETYKLTCINQKDLRYNIECYSIFLEKFFIIGYCNKKESRIRIFDTNDDQYELIKDFQISFVNKIRLIEIYKPDLEQFKSGRLYKNDASSSTALAPTKDINEYDSTNNLQETKSIRLITADNLGNVHIYQILVCLDTKGINFLNAKLINTKKVIMENEGIITLGFSSFRCLDHFFLTWGNFIGCFNIVDLNRVYIQDYNSGLIIDVMMLDAYTKTCCILLTKSCVLMQNIQLNENNLPELLVSYMLKDGEICSDTYGPKCQIMQTIEENKLIIYAMVLTEKSNVLWYQMEVNPKNQLVNC